MRVIAIANQKGGVGKTTTVVNVAGALARQGRHVGLIDLDPQAHLTTFLGVDPQPAEKSAYGVLTMDTPLAQALLDVREHIALLASGLDLAGAEQELVSVVGRETVLRDAINACDRPFDYLFIDCPPSLGLLTLNALGAANEVFIPLQPHFLSLQGLSQLLETILIVNKRINPALRVSGLMFCMFDSRTSLSAEIVREIEEFAQAQRHVHCPWRDLHVFETRIRRNVKLAESPSHGQTIFEYESNCHGAEDYEELAQEIERMNERPAAAGDRADATASTAPGPTAAPPAPPEPATGQSHAGTDTPPAATPQPDRTPTA